MSIDDLLKRVHARLGGYGLDITTSGVVDCGEVRWHRSYGGVRSDERFISAETLIDALWEVLKYEDEADVRDQAEEGACRARPCTLTWNATESGIERQSRHRVRVPTGARR